MTQEQALYKYCLHLGDNALVQSYRLSEWCSNAPILEEDLALTNFALDMTGRAQAILGYAGEMNGQGKTADDLAYRRGEREFYNHLITEQPNGDFACTIAKLLYTATFDYLLYSELVNSADATIAAIAAKTVKEARYHMTHASDWAIRLGDGTEDSHNRMQNGLDSLWMFTGEMFETDQADALLRDKNISADLGKLKTTWLERIGAVLKEATLRIPVGDYMQTGGLQGIHTERLGHILSEMQYLQRAYPDAQW
ncbi:MAG: phenylacetate-CoA oxygenase subunit PaaI [Chitinophagia bacterium]|nr:phenylacetate-CoA oxygenase subunit PaaI [Chitinophagia bacterium]